jgi:hypothetical protein
MSPYEATLPIWSIHIMTVTTHKIYSSFAEAAIKYLTKSATTPPSNLKDSLLESCIKFPIKRSNWNARLSFKTYNRLVADGIMPAKNALVNANA